MCQLNINLFCFGSLDECLPNTIFLCFTAGSATKCFRPHWRFVLTTPTCCFPGGVTSVSTERDRMAASSSASQKPTQDKAKRVLNWS